VPQTDRLVDERVEAPLLLLLLLLLLLHVGGRRLVASSLSVKCIRSCRPFCWGWPSWIRSS
jgi:hypothetical protein